MCHSRGPTPRAPRCATLMHKAAAPVKAWLLLLLQLICEIHGRPSATACPPSCATNELLGLLDQYCSDKV